MTGLPRFTALSGTIFGRKSGRLRQGSAKYLFGLHYLNIARHPG